jgi:uncharacterized protein (DUF1800 family)
MDSLFIRRALLIAAIGAAAACASTPGRSAPPARNERSEQGADPLPLLNRLTWGANAYSAHMLAEAGAARYLDRQLHPGPRDSLPPEAQAQIDAMTISQRPATELASELEQRRKDSDSVVDPEQKKAAQQAYQDELTRLSREAASRMLLRALYSPDQLREQMAWFWMNHFSVHQYKANLRALVADYEERAIRPHALGRFRDLLAATVRHPAMLRYLDNEQNAAGRINENYARELMELHTLGVGGGYAQSDVQELARILTGFGVNMGPDMSSVPNVRPALRDQYLRDGLFEFNPNRHDYGDKLFLGHAIAGRGAAELDEALDLLARHPSTARFVSRKLAVFLAADEPSPALVERMAAAFTASDGDIAATLRAMFASREFQQSLGGKFKDPLHYVVSAVRLAYDGKVILNAGPMINWLNRMGEPLYGRATPDGYPMTRAEWASAGQLATRFEIARAIGFGSAGLFKREGLMPAERAAFPQLANALYYESLQKALSEPTREALDRAASAQEWNMLLLSSPEFMSR